MTEVARPNILKPRVDDYNFYKYLIPGGNPFCMTRVYGVVPGELKVAESLNVEWELLLKKVVMLNPWVSLNEAEESLKDNETKWCKKQC